MSGWCLCFVVVLLLIVAGVGLCCSSLLVVSSCLQVSWEVSVGLWYFIPKYSLCDWGLKHHVYILAFCGDVAVGCSATVVS